MARRPVNAPYTITTEFGVPDSYAKFGRHSGVDYAVESGRPIYAVTSGQLQNIVSPTGGNMVVIFDGTYWHRLMHNSSFSRANGFVTEGEEVAKAGTTGLSTGTHSHWDINKEGIYPTSFNSFIPPADYLSGVYKGGTMSTTDLGLARVFAHGVLGRNGFDGRPNALAGECDADLNKNHVGKETNAKAWEFYNSPEGKAYREVTLPKVYAERDALRKNVSEVTADRDGLIVKLDTANKTIADQTVKITELQTQVNDLTAQNATLTAENTELKKQLASAGDTSNLSGWELIRLGINKLLAGGK